MKRIIIIFIIVFCLISFMEISCLAEELRSPGEFWNILTKVEKAFYQRGLRDGIMECLEKLVPLIKDDDRGLTPIFLLIAIDESYDLYSFIWEHGEAVETVMDDLYKDPANTYIQYPSMCEIACKKLKGEDVEQLLKKAVWVFGDIVHRDRSDRFPKLDGFKKRLEKANKKRL